MKDKIEKLKKYTLRNFIRINSFVVNTRMGYKLARDQVKEGHDVEATDPRWAVSLEIVSNFEFYENRLLPTMSLVYCADLFEAFFFSLLRLSYEHMPQLIPDDIEVPKSVIVQSKSRAEIIHSMVDAEVSHLRSRPVEEWGGYFEKVFQLGVFDEDTIEKLTEILSSRDVILKPEAVVDQHYVKKSGQSGRWKAGDLAEATPVDFNNACHFMQKLIANICNALSGRIKDK